MSEATSREASFSAEPDDTGSVSSLNLNSLRPPKYVLDTKVVAPCHHVPGRKDGKPCNRCRQNAWEKERRGLARSERRRSSGGGPASGTSMAGSPTTPRGSVGSVHAAGNNKRGHSLDGDGSNGAGGRVKSESASNNLFKQEAQAVAHASNWSAKRARLIPSEDRSRELDRAASRVEIRRQDLSPAVKKELLRWENHQINRKLTMRRLELLQTFSFFFCFGISWEDILESAEGPSARPDGWEEENASQLLQIDDERFFVFVQSQETGAWMQVIAKCENVIGKELELYACGASQELVMQLCDPDREELDDEDGAGVSNAAAPAAGIIVQPPPTAPVQPGGGIAPPAPIKEGCVGGTFQVGVVLPPRASRLGHQLFRPPRRLPDPDLSIAAGRMLETPAADAVLQEISDIYQMFLPTSFARAQEWKQVCGKHVPEPLFLPHLAVAWNTNVRCHRDAPNRVQSISYVHGPFEGGDYAFPALNFRTRAPSGTAFWGWTDILEYYVCEWTDRRKGMKGYRASWALTLSADIYDEVMSNCSRGFYDPEKLFAKNDLWDWNAIYDLTGGSRHDLEKMMFK
ncbi:hypothetical protein HDU88_001938 [Geranomyces variabilis]|nr:hypothetical protein HDU88_001938 [Geranomyces variabilis]